MHKIAAVTVPEGDAVMVKRLMPTASLRNFDPFVLCDHFDMSSGGFPDHPHRGFEAITYMLEGGMQHADNLGNRSTVLKGGVQRFTAGKGMVHSETPQGRAKGIQLWINLPQQLKKIEPDYQQVDNNGIVEQQGDGIHIRHIVGEHGTVLLQTPVLCMHLLVEQGHTHSINIPLGYRGFVYGIDGEMIVEGESVASGEALLMEYQPLLTLHATNRSQLLLCFGKPHGEPIDQHGPFVD